MKDSSESEMNRPRSRSLVWSMVIAACSPMVSPAQETILSETFTPQLPSGFRWVREDPSNWRMTPQGLEIRVAPGNMWGPSNDAKNVLLYPIDGGGSIELLATVENRPSEQYEQVDLLWYYSDSDMVKIGQEQVDEQLAIVMGREENDRTRTIAIIPLSAHVVDLKLVAENGRITGFFRQHGTEDWVRAGDCELPAAQGRRPHLSLQAYQGPAGTERWARISRIEIRRLD